MLDTFADWLDEWELALHNTAEGTRKVYLRSVRQFRAWLRDSNLDVAEPGHVTRTHIDGWMSHLERAGRAGATRRVRLIAVRLFLDYVTDQPDGGLDVNPAARIDLPNPDDKPVPIVTDDELRALLGTCNGRDFIDLRDELIIRLLNDAGLRRAELVGINLDDVDLRANEVTVTGKGNKTRIAPFGAKTAIALRKYLRARARRPQADSPALLLAVRHATNGASRLTGGGVGEMLTRRCKLAGIGHKWPHMLRHTWAHDLLDNGANEGVVERLGGWSPGSKMVKRYGSSMADARARKAARTLARGDRV